MEPENWKAIGQAAVQLEAADRAVLDTVQTCFALSDGEFLHFLAVIGKVAAGAVGLRALHLPKP